MQNINSLTQTDLMILVIRFLEDFNKELMVDSYADFMHNWRMLQFTQGEIIEANLETAVDYRQALRELTYIQQPYTDMHAEVGVFVETIQGTNQAWSLMPDVIMTLAKNERELCLAQGAYLDARGHTFDSPQMLRYFGMEFQLEKLNVSLEKYRIHDNNAFSLKAKREILENIRNNRQ